MAEIDRLFDEMITKGASDLHLAEGQPPKLRLNGEMAPLDQHGTLDGQRLEAMMREICPEKRWEQYQRTGDLDFAYAYGAQARFRSNYNRHFAGHGAVFRIIPSDIKSLEDISAPEVLQSFGWYRSGLILVTGPTGSGKSTTLAAIIDHLNASAARHIVTIEEPVEFVHSPKKSTIAHREVGVDVPSFADALRAASRQDIDVLLVGEMRDLETIALAVTAAETGILVFGTLHTNSAIKTVDRIIDVFPSSQQDAIRQSLAVSLKAVCAQLLLRRADGQGRIAAHEILLQTLAVSNTIREGKNSMLTQIMMSSRALGMQLMDDCIERYLDQQWIDGREAYMKALDKDRFKHFAPA